MRPSPTVALLAAALAFVAPEALAQGFSFSAPDDSSKREADAREARIAHDLSTPCRADLRSKKIMVVIGETQSNGYVTAQQADYGPHYRLINDRLRALGLTTYTAEEIRRQVAQAEIDAHFRNDPDAALSASRRLGASFVLRGLIATRAMPNPMMRVNQVDVTMGFTLSSASGKLISTAEARTASYAGADTAKMALTLIDEQADEVVAKLYAEYCRNAGFQSAAPPAKRK
ncbi:MAG: hypothetical protein OEX23_14125 [Betaproteobacteria bacterium]|jgi:hypothetical protein|nr:hypothetical protein [Betaproteobacteria bacterium]